MFISVYSHREQRTQWDHPKFQEIIQLVRECNIIKYAAYRTAAKMCVLQRALHSMYLKLFLWQIFNAENFAVLQ